jgi:transcriptional regulator with XRE-family HTH domain
MQVNTVLQNLSKITTAIRADRGYSIVELATFKKCGVSESTLRRLEKAGKTGYNPKIGTLVKLANGLNVPVGTLVANIQQAKAAKKA